MPALTTQAIAKTYKLKGGTVPEHMLPAITAKPLKIGVTTLPKGTGIIPIEDNEDGTVNVVVAGRSKLVKMNKTAVTEIDKKKMVTTYLFVGKFVPGTKDGKEIPGVNEDGIEPIIDYGFPGGATPLMKMATEAKDGAHVLTWIGDEVIAYVAYHKGIKKCEWIDGGAVKVF